MTDATVTTDETAPSDAPGEKPKVAVETADWKAALSEDLRDDPSLAAIRDVESLAKSYVHSQKLVGREKVALPGKEAGRAEVMALLDRLGRPEDGTAYELAATDLPEDLTISDELTALYRTKAHELGLLPWQAQELFGWFVGENARRFESVREGAQTARDEAKRALEREFGGQMQAKFERGMRAVHALGGEKFADWLGTNGLGDAPEMVRFLIRAGEALAEDRAETGNGGGGFGPDAAGARNEITRLQTDAEFRRAYTTRKDPGHDEAVARMSRLFEIAYPEHRGGGSAP